MKLAWLMVALCVLAAPVMAQAADANATTYIADGSADLTQAAADINESQVGAVPGDWNYGFKRLFENIDRFLTFDKVDKAKKDAKYANARAQEAYVMSGRAAKLNAEGKAAEAQAALAAVDALVAEHDADINESQTTLEAAVDSGDANETEVAEVQNSTRNSISVLQRVYEKVPEQAKDSILQALNNSINNQARHEERVAEKEAEKHGKKTDNETSSDGNWTGTGNETEVHGNETEDLNETEVEIPSNETEIPDSNETGSDSGNETSHGNSGNRTESPNLNETEAGNESHGNAFQANETVRGNGNGRGED